MADTKHVEILIIGSGPAGWTAAVYGARALRDVLVVTGIQPGGQLTITTEVENYPGFTEIQGPDLMVKMQEHAEATGAQAKWLGLPTEEKFKGFGVSACASCDGFFYRGREVMVVGGGNSAVEEALFLTNFASKVTVVHRRDSFRAEKILQERLLKNPKVEVVWNHTLEEVVGDENPLGVTGAKIKDVNNGEVKLVPVHGVFIAIGHAPSTELFRGKLKMKDNGYLITKPGTPQTEIPGVFAAGDVTDETYRQAVTAAGMGCQAALDAERFLSEQEATAESVAAE